MSLEKKHVLMLSTVRSVFGGISSKYYDTAENYGEVYDPKTQTWEPTKCTGRFSREKIIGLEEPSSKYLISVTKPWPEEGE
ncbi:hypothetical protein AXX17_AT4G10720 [Arabidopsis thaliana]|uniref:Galactose oxidase/kelch repeat superfamily protein n=1 Tax=Arabidopsis thaliana TaxID=3702 RepID=A0A178V271_ARATH|nr:hypothetical protein AXX17_AT4G10720 [Arabidopsis thaliana]